MTAVAGEALVVFEATHAITSVTDVSALEINSFGEWTPCDFVVTFDANSVTVQCPAGVEPGAGWRVLTPIGIEWDNDPAILLAVPESGVVG